jgi:type III secretion protein L
VAEWATLLDRAREKLERDVDRVVAVAVALAERLVGAELELDPSRIAAIARSVVAEARGARRATIDAHPVDAHALRDHLAAAGLDPEAFDVRDDESLARGALRLHTDVGVIDAQLAPRLERLAAALRDALA